MGNGQCVQACRIRACLQCLGRLPGALPSELLGCRVKEWVPTFFCGITNIGSSCWWRGGSEIWCKNNFFAFGILGGSDVGQVYA